MKLLLLGGRGQVGWELQRSLTPLGTLRCMDSRDVDLAQTAVLRSRLRDEPFDVLVNAAAYTAVDRAESDADRAQAVNAAAPGVMAEEALRRGAWLLHYSTDYVFDGSGTLPRGEDAPTAPLGVYGATKLAGEEAIRATGCRHLIFRTSWVYAARGENFARTMLRLGAQRESLKVVADQIGVPTGAELLADVSAHALRQARLDASVSGTYHVVPAGETSWHRYAQFLFETARAQGAALRIDAGRVEAIPSSAWPTPARRPLNSRLATAKLQTTFGLTMPPWEAGVARLVAELLMPAPVTR